MAISEYFIIMFSPVILSPFRAKDLVIYTILLIGILLILSCTPYNPSPSTERAIYPYECDGSPIEFGTLKIYDTDSTFLHSIDIDNQHSPTGTYYIDLENGTYLFRLHSNCTNKSAFFKISTNLNTINIELNVCDGQ